MSSHSPRLLPCRDSNTQSNEEYRARIHRQQHLASGPRDTTLVSLTAAQDVGWHAVSPWEAKLMGLEPVSPPCKMAS